MHKKSMPMQIIDNCPSLIYPPAQPVGKNTGKQRRRKPKKQKEPESINQHAAWIVDASYLMEGARRMGDGDFVKLKELPAFPIRTGSNTTAF